MKRCFLPASLHLRAPLPRPPWIHSRLPHSSRSFSLAARLAKDQDAETLLEPKHDETPEGKKNGKKDEGKKNGKKYEGKKNGKKGEGKDSSKNDENKASKKKEKRGQDGADGNKKPKEAKDGSGNKKKEIKDGSGVKKKETKDGSGDNKKEIKDGSGDKKKVKEAKPEPKKGQQGQARDGDSSEGAKKTTVKQMSRRARARAAAASAPESVVERKIAQMRKEIDAMNKRNQKVLGDVPAKPKSEKPLRKVSGVKSLKEALLGTAVAKEGRSAPKMKRLVLEHDFAKLDIEHLNPEDLDFQPVDYEIPPVPRLSYGLDRVLFNPGVYRLQDPRTRVYNFDPYLEKIMNVNEFNFSALSEYKTSSKDEELLALTKKMETKFTGSTSSMSGVLQHFHFLLSNFRPLNHKMLSQEFPKPTSKFSQITLGPSAIFLRRKDNLYAIDADKAFDSPNIMSWLGHSLEKLLTVDRKEFERYRRSSGDAVPGEDESARCYHYSKLGNFLMRSQLDAYDPRLPGKGIFDLKTRAVVSIRMNHEEYETGKGYQIRYDRGEWESYEREFYDMTRATMLKYSLQVRMGRMDGIFVAYHNVERIFGFQYLPIEDMDNVLHGQKDTCLGDQEFKMSISLLDELMQKATVQYPDQTLHMHFHTHQSNRGNPPFMYIFVEPVTEERADEIQNKSLDAQKAFERDIVGIVKDDPSLQAEWAEIQDRVDEEMVGEDDVDIKNAEAAEDEESMAGALEQSSEEVLEAADGSSPENTKDSDAPEEPKGPLMGWTLAVRHRFNGEYVERPTKLTPNDSWTIEYHIRELAESDRWSLYEKIKKTRDDLMSKARDKENNKGLDQYRKLIERYTEKGRKWRERQDALAAKADPQVYEPLGPGSEKEKSSSG
ncbi:hypothetical protein PMIN06_008052 [Paraphaeosphaeria minitans]